MKPTEIRLPLPAGSIVTLRTAAPEDEPFLVALYGGTREEELAQVEWEDGQKELFVKWQFDLQRREYDARFPDAEYRVILVDNHPAGRIWIGRDVEQIRLLDIALLPEFQKRGVGTCLIRWLIAEAGATGKALRHMVYVLNNDAHRFYERLGFVMIDDLGAYKHMEWRSQGDS
jgi:GNAT superfamily N-acetyltransferase